MFCLSKGIINIMRLAFWNSGFDKSIVLVVDSQGHHVNKQKNDLVESESIYVYDELKKPSRLYKSVIRYVPEESVDNGRKLKEFKHNILIRIILVWDLFMILAQNILVELMMIVVKQWHLLYGESTFKSISSF